MHFTETLTKLIKTHFSFAGRASRSQFWKFQSFYLILSIGVGVISGILDLIFFTGPEKTPVFSLFLPIILLIVFLIPNIAIFVRRLHDLNRSGWWSALLLVPFAGFYVLYLSLFKGSSGSNNHGPDPLHPIE